MHCRVLSLTGNSMNREALQVAAGTTGLHTALYIVSKCGRLPLTNGYCFNEAIHVSIYNTLWSQRNTRLLFKMHKLISQSMC